MGNLLANWLIDMFEIWEKDEEVIIYGFKQGLQSQKYIFDTNQNFK
jgi:hypothetical protein